VLLAFFAMLMLKYFSVFQIIREYKHGSKFCSFILYKINLMGIFRGGLRAFFIVKKGNLKWKYIKCGENIF